MKKKYKEKFPQDTIRDIRDFLSNINVLLREQSWCKHDFYACRLTLSNSGLSCFDIGTNGKGRTYEYALASGYGEFMERFQNRILLEPSFIHQIHQILHQENSSLCSALRGIGIRSEFIFDPHERFEKTAIAIKEIKDNDVLLFSNKPEDNKKIENLVLQNLSNADSIMIPFYSVTDDKEIFLPVELCYCASGSNGMCAGNSYQEAFLQGICEIFERYAVRKIIFSKITPPTLPIEAFMGTKASEMYRKLISLGYRIIIKDCSLGIGLPVVGAYIVNPYNSTYNFKVGSDFVQDIALERCLTEAFQSAEGFRGLSLNNPWLDEKECDKEYWYDNFNNIIKNSSGIWPSWILYEKASYKGSLYPSVYGDDNKSDVNIAFKIISELGYNVYIRDNTASNIPALYIYIPGMSTPYDNATHFCNNNSFFFETDLSGLGKIPSSSSDEIEDLYKMLIQIPYKNLQQIDLTSYALYQKSSDIRGLNILQLVMMLAYQIGDYDVTTSLLRSLASISHESKKYFSVAAKFVFLKKKGYDVEDARMILLQIYDKGTVDEVISDFKNPMEIFKDHKLPDSLASMNLTDLTEGVELLKIFDSLNDAFKRNGIFQKDIKNKLY
ncbi:MAG: YcaO-like family protein [Prevotella pallens]|jgi:cytoplasmic protein|nr:YcaO-like family protein [Prevotella histicola]MBF1467511.1 YcaO-like family protein [Prevotella pallens]